LRYPPARGMVLVGGRLKRSLCLLGILTFVRMTAVNVTVVSVIAGLTRNLCKKKRLFGYLLIRTGEMRTEYGRMQYAPTVNAQNRTASCDWAITQDRPYARNGFGRGEPVCSPMCSPYITNLHRVRYSLQRVETQCIASLQSVIRFHPEFIG
jgi:hypothetical protein